MPEKVVEDRQLDRQRGRHQITNARRAVRKHKERAGLQSKPKDPDDIEFYPVEH